VFICFAIGGVRLFMIDETNKSISDKIRRIKEQNSQKNNINHNQKPNISSQNINNSSKTQTFGRININDMNKTISDLDLVKNANKQFNANRKKDFKFKPNNRYTETLYNNNFKNFNNTNNNNFQQNNNQNYNYNNNQNSDYSNNNYNNYNNFSNSENNNYNDNFNNNQNNNFNNQVDYQDNYQKNNVLNDKYNFNNQTSKNFNNNLSTISDNATKYVYNKGGGFTYILNRSKFGSSKRGKTLFLCFLAIIVIVSIFVYLISTDFSILSNESNSDNSSTSEWTTLVEEDSNSADSVTTSLKTYLTGFEKDYVAAVNSRDFSLIESYFEADSVYYEENKQYITDLKEGNEIESGIAIEDDTQIEFVDAKISSVKEGKDDKYKISLERIHNKILSDGETEEFSTYFDYIIVFKDDYKIIEEMLKK
jgi:hypothetical protein